MLNWLLLAINKEALTKSINILWQGLLAMVVVIGIIIIATYIIQNLSERARLAKIICEKEKAQNQNYLAMTTIYCGIAK